MKSRSKVHITFDFFVHLQNLFSLIRFTSLVVLKLLISVKLLLQKFTFFARFKQMSNSQEKLFLKKTWFSFSFCRLGCQVLSCWDLKIFQAEFFTADQRDQKSAVCWEGTSAVSSQFWWKQKKVKKKSFCAFKFRLILIWINYWLHLCRLPNSTKFMSNSWSRER